MRAKESYVEAAVRCYQEELGRTIQRGDAIPWMRGLKMTIQGVESDGTHFMERQIQRFYGVAEPRKANKIKFNKDELSEVRFVAPPEILGEYMHPELFIPQSSSYARKLKDTFKSI